MERKPTANLMPDVSKEGSTKPAKDSKEKAKASAEVKAPVRLPAAALGSEIRPETPKTVVFEQSSEAKMSETKKGGISDAETATDTETGAEAEITDLSSEELEHVIDDATDDHIQAMEGLDAETSEALAPAREYLELYKETKDSEASYATIARKLGVADEQIEANLTLMRQPPVAEIARETLPLPPTHARSETTSIDLDTDVEDEIPVDRSTTANGGGRGTTPPPAPTPSASGSGVGGPGSGDILRSESNEQPETPADEPVAAASLPPKAREYYDNRRNKAGQLLLVGIVGYLIGRRKGRIRTEKRLLPVQKKLEKRVTALEEDMTRKEQMLVAAKAELEAGNVKQPVAARTPERPAPTEQRMQPGLKETRLGIQKPARAERLGHVIMAAEAPKVIERKVMEKPNNIREAFRPEAVKTMRRNELLELSEKIIVEGAPLRRIYESRLIGEKQLRHLVSEYLQGKDITEALRTEMVEREIDFERDPILRDRVRSHLASNDGGGGLGDLLASVGIVEHEPDAQLEHRIRKEAAQRAKLDRKEHQHRMASDIALVTTIVTLTVAVIVLALTR